MSAGTDRDPMDLTMEDWPRHHQRDGLIEQCMSCWFYQPYTEEGEPVEFGECRRYPPVVVTGRQSGLMYPTRWPRVTLDAWCGEWARAVDA